MGSSHNEEEHLEEDRFGRPQTPMNFIRQAVIEDLRLRAIHRRPHALPAGAQRLPSHRPREGGLDQLRHRAGIRRPLQPAVR